MKNKYTLCECCGKKIKEQKLAYTSESKEYIFCSKKCACNFYGIQKSYIDSKSDKTITWYEESNQYNI